MSKFRKLLAFFHDPIASLVNVAVLVALGWALPIFFPGAGTYDMGLLQALGLGLLMYTVSLSAGWVSMWVHFPNLLQILQNEQCDNLSFSRASAFFWLFTFLAAMLQLLTLLVSA